MAATLENEADPTRWFQQSSQCGAGRIVESATARAASVDHLGSGHRDGQASRYRQRHRRQGLVLRHRQSLAVRQQREHERAAAPILPDVHQPLGALPTRPRPRRRRPQLSPTNDPRRPTPGRVVPPPAPVRKSAVVAMTAGNQGVALASFSSVVDILGDSAVGAIENCEAHWPLRVTANRLESIPMSAITQAIGCSRLVHHQVPSQAGRLVLSRQVRVGIGAVLGGGGNHLVGNSFPW